jgi:septal ring factor EnvC (AmiA/AmiB activator)
MSTAFEKFAELETRIGRTVELVKTTRQENEGLLRELAAARSNMTRLEREVEELKRERDVIKNKVETMLEALSELSDETGIESQAASNRR